MLGLRRWQLGAVAVAGSVGVVLAAACGGNTTTIADGDGGGGAEAGTSDGNAMTTTDGETTDGASGTDGASDDGETISDGGDNLNPEAGDDAGESRDGSLADGGTCNTIANGATAVMSTCASAIPILGGGDLVAGTYYVTAVEALGAPTFCAMKFKSDRVKETLELGAAGLAGSPVNVVADVDGVLVRRTTATITPNGGNKSPAAWDESCPLTASKKTDYESVTTNATTTLTLRLPYGGGEGIYTFVKQ